MRLSRALGLALGLRRPAESADDRQARPVILLGGGAAATPYPTFDVARPDKWQHDWDEKTRALVLRRVRDVPAYRFFKPDEAELLEAVCSRLLKQDDRPPGQRVPIAPWIDDRLAAGDGNGYRYDDMPPDDEAYRRGLAAFDRTAALVAGRRFVDLGTDEQDELIRQVAEGTAPAEAWHDLPMERFWQLLLSDVVSIYYAHPAAWAEIGFNGPSSPRGHMRLDLGRRDPWEAAEQSERSSVEIVRRAPGTGNGGGGVATH